jgi:hypothetical protein
MERAAGKAAALQKPRVILALLLLLALVSVMLLDGYLRSEIGNDARVRDGAAYDKVPEKILDGGPILTFANGAAKTQSVPKKTIVLTFDDGPTATWTPEVLKVLEENDVEATFFMVGSMVSRYPDVVKTLVDQGNEVGIHTFTRTPPTRAEADAVGPRGRGRHHHHAVPRPVLVGDQRRRQLQLARLQGARQSRLHQRLRRHRQ